MADGNLELYKAYRPATLADVHGQGHIVSSLQSMEAIPHFLLFHGPSGCGKTTIARIIAKQHLACGDHDLHELNSANMARGIDAVREISNNCMFAPLTGDARVYIIDEMHQMTKDGQNAFLKLLEDTPKHVWFMGCTTHPEKLEKAIRTRATDFAVKLLGEADMLSCLRTVCKQAKLRPSKAVATAIVGAAEGSPRAALVLLNKVKDIPTEEAQLLAIEAGGMDEKEAIDLCRQLCNPNAKWADVKTILQAIKSDPEQVRYAVLGYARAILLKADGTKARHCFRVIQSFRDNFYDSKAAGLAAASYEVVHKVLG